MNTEAVTEHPYAPPPAVLSSRKGPSGSQVDLLKAQVNGDTLTIELQYKAGLEDNRRSRSGGGVAFQPAGAVASTYAIDEVSVTDEVTAKTYSVLKDPSGQYMASPLRTDQGKQLINISIPSGKDKPVSVSFKFAALPVDTKAVSITIPDVGSYKNIPLSR
ncbi:MAG: hypothetical protein EOO39_01835 [Cytophagaceae bacterium]|nr:MAG: hypothetical protein EOO39_01835 [Cytophagaceae bacterium]